MSARGSSRRPTKRKSAIVEFIAEANKSLDIACKD